MNMEEQFKAIILKMNRYRATCFMTCFREQKEKAKGYVLKAQEELEYWNGYHKNEIIYHDQEIRIKQLKAVIELAKKERLLLFAEAEKP